MTSQMIGEGIRKRRESLHLRQEDLSQMADVSLKTIHQIEQGKGNPSLKTLQKLFEVLGLDIKVIIKTMS